MHHKIGPYKLCFSPSLLYPYKLSNLIQADSIWHNWDLSSLAEGKIFMIKWHEFQCIPHRKLSDIFGRLGIQCMSTADFFYGAFVVITTKNYKGFWTTWHFFSNSIMRKEWSVFITYLYASVQSKAVFAKLLITDITCERHTLMTSVMRKHRNNTTSTDTLGPNPSMISPQYGSSINKEILSNVTRV